ncbi:acyltransferase [Paenibacillus puldeungensis]|uniref:Acyltransferase n=1 Tax=Paenibacillus puldeungensis TaxID=696536 RepID=A0ABW3S4G2_9BACL
MKKARLEEVEILRGIAFLAVVLQHVIAGVFGQPDVGDSSIIIGTTLLGISRFAVPLFVFITGVVLFYNYDGKLNYLNFMRKRFKQIILPYLGWTIFYHVWVCFLSGVSATTTWNELLNMVKLTLTGKASYHLWFMVMIIPFYFLYPVFRSLLSRKRKASTNLIVVAVIFALNLILIYALRQGVISSDNPRLGFIFDYLDRNFLFWIFYFMLGGLVGLYYDQWRKFVDKTKYICMALLAVCLYIIYENIVRAVAIYPDAPYLWSANVTVPLKPLMMATITLLIVVVFAGTMKLVSKPSRLSNLIGLFGKYSFGTYLMHAFILRFTKYFSVEVLSMLDVYSQTIISFILCSAISLFLTIRLSRIKISVGDMMVGRV